MKPRIQPYISPENFHWLKAMAKRPGLSESTIIDGAVTAYRAGESDNKREAAINRRLDRLTRQFGRIERRQARQAGSSRLHRRIVRQQLVLFELVQLLFGQFVVRRIVQLRQHR